jgi:hypothetical protein
LHPAQEFNALSEAYLAACGEAVTGGHDYNDGNYERFLTFRIRRARGFSATAAAVGLSGAVSQAAPT